MLFAMKRRVVITGANRGLGLELARACVERGDEVYATCRSPGSATALASLSPAGILELDVASGASVEAFRRSLVNRVDAVDLLINNAGVNGTEFGAERERAGVLDLEPENFEAQMRVNAVGPMLVTRALRPLLAAAGTSVVWNVSSQLGSLALGKEMRRDVGYNASKAALNMITRASAGDLAAEGVIVVSVHPGWVRTDMGGPDAPLSARDSAEAILATTDRLRPEDSGAFLRWDGEEHPW